MQELMTPDIHALATKEKSASFQKMLLHTFHIFSKPVFFGEGSQQF